MSAKRTFAGFLIGILMVQAAWIAAMPAFRGPDEFDHVFRAEGVTHGAIMPGETISRIEARGTMTTARRSVIDAASNVCQMYLYTRYYDCYVRGSYQGQWGQVGSGAARYNPTYYAVAGYVGRLFQGVAVNYAIRIVTALMCALLLAWAATLWTAQGRSDWRTLGLLSALTPSLLFSTAIAAPNGVSYSAAVLLWIGGLIILKSPDSAPRTAIAGATVGAVVMCNTHTTGPLWLFLITVAWALLNPRGVWATLRNPRHLPMVATIGAGAFAATIWTFVAGANMPHDSGLVTGSPQIGELALQEISWIFQTIAAFPLRNEMAQPAVYFLWLLGFGMLLVRGLRSKGGELRAVLWIIGGIIVTQTALTYVGFKTDGYAWQGRYGLPFTVGLALVPAFATDLRTRIYAPVYHCALVAMMLAAGLSVWHVAANDSLPFQRPWSDFIAGGPVVVGLVATAGTALMVWTVTRSSDPIKEPVAT